MHITDGVCLTYACQQERDDLRRRCSSMEDALKHATAQRASSSHAGTEPQPPPLAVMGPTAEQQALMARMAERLEALEAGHRSVGQLCFICTPCID